MFVRAVKLKDLLSGYTMKIGDADVTLQSCGPQSGRFLVIVDAPAECRIDADPAPLGPEAAT